MVKQWRDLLAKADGGVPELARVTVAAATAAQGADSEGVGLGPVSVSPVAGEALLSLAPSFSAPVEVADGGRGRLVVVWTTTAAGGGGWGAVEGELVESGSEASVRLPEGALASGRGYRFVVFGKDAAGVVGGQAVQAGYRTNSAPRVTVPRVFPRAGGVSNGQPVLSARLRDGDGAQLLAAEFTVSGAGGSFTVPGRCAGVSRCVGSGRVTAAVPAGRLADGQEYGWSVRVQDPAGWSAPVAGEPFTVDTRVAAPSVTASAFTDQSWTVTPPADNTFRFSAAGADFFSVSIDDRWPVTIDADANGVGTWSWAPTSGWHSLSVTATDAVNNTSPATRFAFGVGSAPALLSPAAHARSATTFAVVAHGPAAATAGQVSWRPANGGAWTVLDPVAVSHPAPGYARLETRLEVAGLPVGLIRVRVSFTPGDPAASDARWVSVVDSAFAVADTASTELGPGSVALPTGEFLVSASDAGDAPFGMPVSVGRVWRTGTAGQAAAGDWAGYGPGWAAALDMGGASTAHVADGSGLVDGPDLPLRIGWIALQFPDGGVDMFTRAGGGNGAYLPVGQSKLAGSRLVRSGSGDASQLEVSGADGTITTFTRAGGTWSAVAVSAPGRKHTARLGETRGSLSFSWLVSGISTAGGQCADLAVAAAKTDRGCRMLGVARDSAAGNRITQAVLRAYDPATGGIVERVVARYDYDGTARLVAAWNPLVGPQPLKTRYGYDTSHRVTSVTPASADTGSGPALTPTRAAMTARGGWCQQPPRVRTGPATRSAGWCTG